MKTICSLCAVLFFASHVSAQYYHYASLNVQHPQRWASDQGTLEEASVVVTPSASYSVHDIFLTFSARGGNFLPDDSIEVILYFSLPQRAFVNDLWLWFGEDTLRALLADRSVARATYENIVQRRQDPALLTKEYGSGNYFQLRIYPMRGDGTRKVKMRYVVPHAPSEKTINLELPLWIFKASKNTLNHVSVIVKKDSVWREPRFGESLVGGFTAMTDPIDGAIDKIEIPGSLFSSLTTLTLQLTRNILSGDLFVERFDETPTGGVFQLSLNPARLLEIPVHRNMLFLIDYDSTAVYYGNRNRAARIEELREALLVSQVEQDSFSVIFSAKGAPHRISSSWVYLDSASVDALLSPLSDVSTILDTVDLPSLLFDGVKFLQENGNSGDVFLFASSATIANLATANRLLDSLRAVMHPDTRVHIVDDNYYTVWYFVGDRYYWGNGYFYTNLAQQTKGSYVRRPYHENENVLTPMIVEGRGSLEFFELSISLASGFTYAKLYSGFESGRLPLFNSASAIGFFEGSFPLTVSFGGKFREQFYFQQFQSDDTSVVHADSTIKTLWADRQISSYSSDYNDYARQQVTSLSMNHRILSRYTAFIALEPGQTLCDTCVAGGGEVIIVDVEDAAEPPASYEVLQAYPNPFNPSTTLRIRLPEGTKAKEVSLIIYNMLGQEVRHFDVALLTNTSFVDLIWDGRGTNGAQVSSGIYFAVLTTPGKRYSLKLLLVK